DSVAGQVYRERRMVRLDSYQDVRSAEAIRARDAGARSSVGCPVFVGDRLWGALTTYATRPEGVDERLIQPLLDCADLLATAVHNAWVGEDLHASRERLVNTADATRRRFERDLHDGAQQRLVALLLELRSHRRPGQIDPAAVAEEVDSILD